MISRRFGVKFCQYNYIYIIWITRNVQEFFFIFLFMSKNIKWVTCMDILYQHPSQVNCPMWKWGKWTFAPNLQTIQ